MGVMTTKEEVIKQVQKVLKKGTDLEKQTIKILARASNLSHLESYLSVVLNKINTDAMNTRFYDKKAKAKFLNQAKEILKMYFPYWSDARIEEEINFYLQFSSFYIKKMNWETKIIAEYLEKL